MKDKEPKHELAAEAKRFVNSSIITYYDMADFATEKIEEQLKNTLTLESRIGESGELDKPSTPEEPYFSDKDSDVHVQWQIYLNRYNQAPTIKQMPSIIREQKEEIENLKSSIAIKYVQDLGDQLTKAKQENDNYRSKLIDYHIDNFQTRHPHPSVADANIWIEQLLKQQ